METRMVSEEHNKIILVRKKKPAITRDRRNCGAIIRIDAQAADLLEDFATKAKVPVSKMASQFIKYAADRTIIDEEEE